MSRLLDQRLFAPGFPSLPSLIYTSVKRRYGPGVLPWKSSGPKIYEGGLHVKIRRTRDASNIAVGESIEVECCPNSPASVQYPSLGGRARTCPQTWRVQERHECSTLEGVLLL
jgi:hypothetical protein